MTDTITKRAPRGRRTVAPGVVDRIYRGVVNHAAWGDLVVPAPDDIRSAILELARRGPWVRLGLTATPSGRWLFDPGRLREVVEAMVVPLPDPDPDRPTADDVATVLRHGRAHPAGPLTYQLWHSPFRVALSCSHDLADGRTIDAMTSGILRFAADGVLPEWAQSRDPRAPLARALLHTFSSRAAVSGLLDARRAARHEDPAPELPDPGPGVPATRTVVLRGAGREVRREILQWRRAHAPRASQAMVSLSIVRLALHRVGLAQQPRVNLVVDNRRYLPRPRRVHGNFVSGLALPVPELADPSALTERVQRVVESGRPLAVMALGAARALARRGGAEQGPGGAVHPAAPIGLTHVFMGRWVSGDAWPWAGERREMACWTEPGDPAGVAVLVSQAGGGWWYNLSHHRSGEAAERIAEAARLAAEEPVSLLESARERWR
ncbi:hypothetical protein GGQ54_001343 [Naumannella cuiyingiana]|uniref:Condensation domain-containing protein n=1 Tax=Naumannella cuiyingiana TaxID=1347891 RepID=A0A7Z0D8Q3_9ACTN|nr:hypothetical protein [Naumannella cuiyingiana]NYI70783.1 hypothetical protein [Naumannella cuiyingiana]